MFLSPPISRTYVKCATEQEGSTEEGVIWYTGERTQLIHLNVLQHFNEMGQIRSCSRELAQRSARYPLGSR
uniref:Uncharacterized protein n=1 Tax=Anguilla anguilla TaxID=7936 RepID=A0A0E9UEU1_ANGAN